MKFESLNELHKHYFSNTACVTFYRDYKPSEYVINFQIVNM